MKFYEEVVLKNCKEFQELSTEDKRRCLTIFKHKYLAMWFSKYVFSPELSCLVFNLAICIANLLVFFFVKSNIFICIFFILTIPYPIIFIILSGIIDYKLERKKIDSIKVQEWIIEKFQNIWLLDGRVISLKDWWYIKKTDKKLYKLSRSEECNHWCYSYSFDLAYVLKDPHIKIIWFIGLDMDHTKFGHGVIEKKGFIYNTNMRRTYPKAKYFAAHKAKIFKEYSLKDYQDEENFHGLEWDKFGKWCQERNAIRNT